MQNACHGTMPSSVIESWLRAISFSLCATLVEAKYPFSSGPKAKLVDDTSVSFDPLGVAAVLGTPRADASAAKLYVQYDQGTFHWPHTSMIGGTLPAMQMLVEYFTSGLPSKSLSPPIKMCAKATTMIPVRSNSVFRELPLDFSNVWLNHLIGFKSGDSNPGNDFMVIYMDGNTANHKMLEEDPGYGWWMVGRLSLYFLDLVNGAMILASMLIGILAADIWAFTLFFFYGSYWISSALITFLPMVQVFTPPIIKDGSPLYAVYERPEGGTVIFKGCKDDMEAWARRTWKYEPTWVQTMLHWSWMVTGSLAAFSSVACMVNMHGYLQLAFLAVLVYATVAEIVATKISRVLQIKAKGPVHSELLKSNDKRTRGIIFATVAIKSLCRLEGLDWIQMGLLPNTPVFSHMQAMLAEINAIQQEVEISQQSIHEDVLKAKIEKVFGESQNDKNDAANSASRPGMDLVDRLKTEMRDAVKEWIERMIQENKVTTMKQ